MGMIARFFLLVVFLSFGELYLLILAAQEISVLTTLLLCMATGILGGGLVRAQGLRAWVEIQKSLGKGQIPAVEIVSGLILVVIGTLLLTPGFITDTIAFLLLIPPLRKGASLAVIAYFKKNVKVQTFGAQSGGNPPYQRPQHPEDIVLEVEAQEVTSESR